MASFLEMDSMTMPPPLPLAREFIKAVTSFRIDVLSIASGRTVAS